ncbi:hypothetical protein [Mycobacterium sp. IS-1556]|uniref:hypothetical protein n=1 Tax=Mycobacterium sp. IS-1556 TaxID=1772276 RepID=UPI0007415F5B|nr:hypothetical protein [Mycobacterium sp. IS-1556]KUH90629.1 hypothetical protein AU187_24465 [Mycobacterium sp. IS-1556]
MPTINVPNLPVPAGAAADEWCDLLEGPDAIRSLNWSKHDAAGVGVGVDGLQYGDGRVDRFVTIYADNPELTADEARAVAVALNEAAAALELVQSRLAAEG